MSQQVELPPERSLQWSALMDGEADERTVAELCSVWRSDEAARRRWHAWHLVGDALRSDELASAPGRDLALIAALRSRLAGEPVVLAPTTTARRSRWRWSATAAVAAGFAAVVGAALVLDVPSPTAESPALARNSAPTLLPMPVQTVAVPPEPAAAADPKFIVADGQLIRDVRLDRYLAAHKPVGGSRGPTVPSSFAPPRAADTGRSR